MTAACSIMSVAFNSSVTDIDQDTLLVSSLRNTVGLFYNVSSNLPCFNISEEYYPCADITGRCLLQYILHFPLFLFAAIFTPTML